MDLERCAPRWRSQSHNNINKIMQFAGSWSNMSEKDFNDFYEEIEQRRSIIKSISVKSEYYQSKIERYRKFFSS